LLFIQKVCPGEQLCQDLVKVGAVSLMDAVSGNQDAIVPWPDVRKVYLYRSPKDSLRPVTGNSIANRFTSGNAETDVFVLCGQVQQNNKRVGNGFAKAPHPLKVR
jgi:hypothetical protein